MVHILTKETSSGLMPSTFSYKAAVKCATTADATWATAFAAGQAIDGYTLIVGDRILIKNQTSALKNGVYTVNATGAPTRATDMNAATMFPGAVVAVEQGTVNADSGWVCTAEGITLETSDIPWVLFGGMKAGTGLSLTADVMSVARLPMEAVTVGTDTGLSIFTYGSIDTPKTIISGDEVIPFQMYLQSTTNASVSENSLINMYLKTENTTIDQPNRRMQNVLVNTKLNFDCYDAYAVQAHITVATEMKTTNANAHITGISGKAVLSAAATAGWVTAGLFIVEGAGAVTQMCYGVSIVAEVGAAAVQALLHLYSDETINAAIGFTETTHLTNLFDFAAVGGFLSADTGAVPAASINKIAVDIGGVPGYIPIYADW